MNRMSLVIASLFLPGVRHGSANHIRIEFSKFIVFAAPTAVLAVMRCGFRWAATRNFTYSRNRSPDSALRIVVPHLIGNTVSLGRCYNDGMGVVANAYSYAR